MFDLHHEISNLAKKFQGHNYAIRGTTSLILQGLDFRQDDIDVLCDEETAKFLNLPYSESKQFKSYYKKLDNNVEIYGAWQIKNTKGGWSEVLEPKSDNTKIITIEGIEIPVTTIDFELHCYALMGRWNVLTKLKKFSKLAND